MERYGDLHTAHGRSGRSESRHRRERRSFVAWRCASTQSGAGEEPNQAHATNDAKPRSIFATRTIDRRIARERERERERERVSGLGVAQLPIPHVVTRDIEGEAKPATRLA